MAGQSKLADWKSRKVQKVTLPSGFEAEIEVPDLVQMIQAGEVPNRLIKAANDSQKIISDPTEADVVERMKEQHEFAAFLLAHMVKAPAITVEDYNDLPALDKDMLMSFATRATDVDAVGNQIGGLHTDKRWRRFHGLSDSDSYSPGF